MRQGGPSSRGTPTTGPSGKGGGTQASPSSHFRLVPHPRSSLGPRSSSCCCPLGLPSLPSTATGARLSLGAGQCNGNLRLSLERATAAQAIVQGGHSQHPVRVAKAEDGVLALDVLSCSYSDAARPTTSPLHHARTLAVFGELWRGPHETKATLREPTEPPRSIRQPWKGHCRSTRHSHWKSCAEWTPDWQRAMN